MPKENELDPIVSDQYKNLFITSLDLAADKAGVKHSMFNTSYNSKFSSAEYNKLARLCEWEQERYAHNEIEILPLFSDQLSDIMATLQTKYIYLPYCFYYGQKQNTTYYSSLYNLKTGKREYSYTIVEGGKPNKKKMQKLALTDFEYVKK